MNYKTLLFLLFIHLAACNIIFHWVQPSCSPSARYWSGCLSGQHCTPNGKCVSNRSYCKRELLDSGHTGLLHGRSPTLQPSQSAAQSSANGEATIAPTNTVSSNSQTATSGPVTTDGTCGAAVGGTVCGTWQMGSCCSMYGFCGNTTAHCGEGCQSGPCFQAPTQPAPGPSPAPQAANPGAFEIVGLSGVPAMHATLMENGRIVFLDKVENYTELKLPDGQYAYSSEYDPLTNQTVPLGYRTNAFCSGGTFLNDGRLINLGGNAPLTYVDPTVGDGFTGIRYLQRSLTNSSLDGQDWVEPGNKLSSARWYASAQTLADGSVFVASGSLNGLDPTNTSNNNPTYEILSPNGTSSGISVPMDILVKAQPYYMYPFIHLLRDGSLFVFVSKTSELFDASSNSTIKQFPDLDGYYRTYPNTGGSVLLPMSSANNWTSDVVICGGGAYQDLSSPTDASCGRISPLADDAGWEMDAMPEGRVMVEGTLLPDGTVVWMNGCNLGAQGYSLGQYATTQALIYNGSSPLGHRFTADANSTIARVYHSVALLNEDATVTVAGSNPEAQPVLEPSLQMPFDTEFRVETYTPPYLVGDRRTNRPTNVTLSTTTLTPNATSFIISFTDPANGSDVSVALYHGGFVTHSLHMAARMAILDNTGYQPGVSAQQLNVTMPPSANVAVPGPYMVFVLVDGTPSVGTWVTVVPPASASLVLSNSTALNVPNGTTSGEPISPKSDASRGGAQADLGGLLCYVLLLLLWQQRL